MQRQGHQITHTAVGQREFASRTMQGRRRRRSIMAHVMAEGRSVCASARDSVREYISHIGRTNALAHATTTATHGELRSFLRLVLPMGSEARVMLSTSNSANDSAASRPAAAAVVIGERSRFSSSE